MPHLCAERDARFDAFGIERIIAAIVREGSRARAPPITP
jgi:hypothetical protein